MTDKTKEYRTNLVETFLQVLEEKQLDWKKEWQGSNLQRPVNAKNGRCYHGINQFWLGLIALDRGYTDPRWATFKQVQEKGWRLEQAKGKGVKVEYWYPFDKEKKKSLTWDEFKAAGGVFGERYFLRAQYAVVFNGSHIAGIPELSLPEEREISPDILIEKLSEEMKVDILNDGGDEAYYDVMADQIHLPLPEVFNSNYAYASTALHELAHSTGAVHRLNRDLSGRFGSKDYAFEELIAEISSCFMSANLQMEQSSSHIENHKAYVSNWIAFIREKPESLIRAIQQAEKAASYMEYQAGLIEQKEFETVQQSSMEVKEEKMLMVEEKPDAQKLKIQDAYSIYQLKHDDETRDLFFQPYDRLQAAGRSVDQANYDLIYSASLTPKTSLEDIYTRFNIDHPKDFKGHSLSISDVVVIHQNGQSTAHYVDRFGFPKVPEFLIEEKGSRVSPDVQHQERIQRQEELEVKKSAPRRAGRGR